MWLKYNWCWLVIETAEMTESRVKIVIQLKDKWLESLNFEMVETVKHWAANCGSGQQLNYK